MGEGRPAVTVLLCMEHSKTEPTSPLLLGWQAAAQLALHGWVCGFRQSSKARQLPAALPRGEGSSHAASLEPGAQGLG